MQRTYLVIKEYENSNGNPIELKAGDEVRIGVKFEDDGTWPNWIHCVSKSTGKSGWTPVQILQINGKSGVAVTDYTAKEMTVTAGDVVTGYQELNGWLWCVRQSDGQSGWVPANRLL